MPWTQIVHWMTWGVALLGAGGAIVALVRLRYAERFLPEWESIEGLRALVPVRRAELEQVEVELDSRRQELGALDGELGELRRLRAWQEQNPEASARIQQAIADLGENEAKLAAARDELAQAEQRRNDAASEADLLRRESERLSADLAKGRSEATELTDQRARLSEEISALSARLSDLKSELQELINDKQEAKSAQVSIRAALQADEKKLDAVNRERLIAIAERDVARAEHQSLQAALGALRQHLENVSLQLREQDQSDRPISDVLEDVARPAIETHFHGASTQSDESSMLGRFERYLQARGLFYPQRVQYAFHTSLKAAHINPLVVLAGVSGTGKSALPQAYGEAMGINVLTVAIQPGWSSPQDLLGFYNHLERKYKATDLLRSLAQMSRHSEDDLPGLKIASRSDEMLLVLLDEMNLARVEYYFSEFLSRLEQRRDCDESDWQRRRQVALQIDVGGTLGSESSPVVFPGPNVLFVGTMNEDESTQSLSEKVVDRANVLRFGAPRNLRPPHNDTAIPTDEFLPFETWRSWVRDYREGQFRIQGEALSRINNQLVAINRPFGHRVYRAILDYLANYPGAESNVDDALADQIEQKIIPKLRGIDNQDTAAGACFDTIREVIVETHDNDLRTAFDAARQQPFFEWFGVRRN